MDLLHDKGQWKADKLTEIATSLHALATTEHPDDVVVPLFGDGAVTNLNEES